jgi:hypothetical protein
VLVGWLVGWLVGRSVGRLIGAHLLLRDFDPRATIITTPFKFQREDLRLRISRTDILLALSTRPDVLKLLSCVGLPLYVI